MTSCDRCGERNAEGGAYCQSCGAPLAPAGRKHGAGVPARSSVTCGTCHTPNPPGTNFCHNCGEHLSPVAPSPFPQEVHARPSSSPGAFASGRPRLVAVRRDGTDGPTYQITGEQFDVGRTEGDLLFEDPHIGNRHARILERGGQFVVTPLDLTNGVYVRLRQPVDLESGDYVLIGKQVLRFEVPAEAERSVRPAIELGVVLFGTPVKPPWGRLRQLTAAGTTRDVFHLTRNEVVLGREQGDVVFSDDEFLSRRHAQLQCRGGRVTLSDLGSSNGTFIRLRAQHALMPGEMLRLGDELLRFEIG